MSASVSAEKCRLLTTVAAAAAIVLARLSSGMEFVEEPRDSQVIQGQTVTLNCTVRQLVGQVQWLRDGFGLGPGPTFDGFPRYSLLINNNTGEHRLRIVNSQLEDDSLFECQVPPASETSPALRSRKAALTVLVPPESVTISAGSVLQVVAGATLNLSCTAVACKPAAQITWSTDVTPAATAVNDVTMTTTTLPDGKRLNVTSWLAIRPIRGDDGRHVTCQVVHTALSSPQTITVQLDISYLPVISMTSTPSRQLVENDQLLLTCTADAKPSSLSWRWFIDGELMSDQQSNSFSLQNIGRQLNNRVVTCVAANSLGSALQSTTIRLNYGPRFTTESCDRGTDLNSPEVVLSCPVDSNPTAFVVWTRLDSPLILSNATSLRLGPVTEDKFGSYVITASVDGFQSISRTVHLLKNGPPRIVSSAEQSSLPSGTGTAKLECHVTATPRPNYITWSRNGVTLNYLSRFSVNETDVEDGRQSVLLITDLQTEDFGEFNCTTANSYGSTFLTITLSPATTETDRTTKDILAGVFGGLAAVIVIVIITVVIVVLYRRRKSPSSESGSDSSETQMVKSSSSTDSSSDSKLEFADRAVNCGLSPSTCSAETCSTDLSSRHDTVLGGSYHVSAVSQPGYLRPYNNVNMLYNPSTVLRDPYNQNVPQLTASPAAAAAAAGTAGLATSPAIVYSSNSSRPHSFDDYRGRPGYYHQPAHILRTSSVRDDVTTADTHGVTSLPPANVNNSKLCTNV